MTRRKSIKKKVEKKKINRKTDNNNNNKSKSNSAIKIEDFYISKFTCPFIKCLKKDKTYKTKQGFINHFFEIHQTKEDESYKCFHKGCSKKPTNIGNFINHIYSRTHKNIKLPNPPYKCAKCNTYFGTEQNCKTHFTKQHTDYQV